MLNLAELTACSSSWPSVLLACWDRGAAEKIAAGYKKFVASRSLPGSHLTCEPGLQNRSETSRATAMFDLPTLLDKIPDE